MNLSNFNRDEIECLVLILFHQNQIKDQQIKNLHFSNEMLQKQPQEINEKYHQIINDLQKEMIKLKLVEKNYQSLFAKNFQLTKQLQKIKGENKELKALDRNIDLELYIRSKEQLEKIREYKTSLSRNIAKSKNKIQFLERELMKQQTYQKGLTKDLQHQNTELQQQLINQRDQHEKDLQEHKLQISQLTLEKKNLIRSLQATNTRFQDYRAKKQLDESVQRKQQLDTEKKVEHVTKALKLSQLSKQNNRKNKKLLKQINNLNDAIFRLQSERTQMQLSSLKQIEGFQEVHKIEVKKLNDQIQKLERDYEILKKSQNFEVIGSLEEQLTISIRRNSDLRTEVSELSREYLGAIGQTRDTETENEILRQSLVKITDQMINHSKEKKSLENLYFQQIGSITTLKHKIQRKNEISSKLKFNESIVKNLQKECLKLDFANNTKNLKISELEEIIVDLNLKINQLRKTIFYILDNQRLTQKEYQKLLNFKIKIANNLNLIDLNKGFNKQDEQQNSQKLIKISKKIESLSKREIKLGKDLSNDLIALLPVVDNEELSNDFILPNIQDEEIYKFRPKKKNNSRFKKTLSRFRSNSSENFVNRSQFKNNIENNNKENKSEVIINQNLRIKLNNSTIITNVNIDTNNSNDKAIDNTNEKYKVSQRIKNNTSLDIEKMNFVHFENNNKNIKEWKFNQFLSLQEDFLKFKKSYMCIRNDLNKSKVSLEEANFENEKLKIENKKLKSSIKKTSEKLNTRIKLIQSLKPNLPKVEDDLDNSQKLLEELLKYEINIKEIDRSLMELHDEETLILEETENEIYVKQGTVEKLFSLLFNFKYSEKDYLLKFLISFRSFTTQETILNMLITHYQKKNKQELIQNSILKFLFLWTKYFYHDFEQNNKLAQKMIHFLESPQNQKRESNKKIILTIANNFNSKLRSIIPKEEILVHTKISILTPDPILPKKLPIPKNSTILDFNEIEFSRQLTLFEMKLFQKIQLRELLNKSWSKKDPKLTPNILKTIRRFNETTLSFVTTILSTEKVKQRANVIKSLLKIAKCCREIGNYNSIMEIVGTLHNASVRRLSKTWKHLLEEENNLFETLTSLISTRGNYSNFRKDVKQRNGMPILPYIGVYLTDLTFIEDGNPGKINGLINFSKQRQIAHVIHEIRKFQEIPFHFKEIPQMQEYLLNLKFEPDENLLYDMSLKLEARDF
ncbi:hypothetical protein M0813_14594 [Anaeramoeba flamelloides]|uniref:Ras guanine nucleotide exchange factor n=1 Tax=Anaeramoeba flamelloides TaxID=1746091 RepID=A0ABQ8Z574_9EUKA|nr:hypothetical protein M0813_14594 [Anaeramoeba flamelloides]